MQNETTREVRLVRRSVPDQLRYLAERLRTEPLRASTCMGVSLALDVLADELTEEE
jgi:hypothetical protein